MGRSAVVSGNRRPVKRLPVAATGYPPRKWVSAPQAPRPLQAADSGIAVALMFSRRTAPTIETPASTMTNSFAIRASDRRSEKTSGVSIRLANRDARDAGRDKCAAGVPESNWCCRIKVRDSPLSLASVLSGLRGTESAHRAGAGTRLSGIDLPRMQMKSGFRSCWLILAMPQRVQPYGSSRK